MAPQIPLPYQPSQQTAFCSSHTHQSIPTQCQISTHNNTTSTSRPTISTTPNNTLSNFKSQHTTPTPASIHPQLMSVPLPSPYAYASAKPPRWKTSSALPRPILPQLHGPRPLPPETYTVHYKTRRAERDDIRTRRPERIGSEGEGRRLVGARIMPQ
jgi:hypothetical protein